MGFAATRRRAALGLAAAALAAAVLAPSAGATQRLAGNVALTPEPSGPSSSSSTATQDSMALEFTSRTAKVAGPGALVRVKCTGLEARSCVGTLAIEAPGEPAEVAFSIDRGEERVLVVPLGEQREIFEGIIAVRTRVIAETVQETGDSVRTTRTLSFQ